MATKKNNKLIQEISILVVVMLVIGGVVIYRSNSTSQKAPVVVTKPLDTNFDLDAVNQLQTKDSNYPDVTPTSSDLGKTDPFSK